MPAVCVCVWMRLNVCVLEASSHLFDRWDCAFLSVSFILWITFVFVCFVLICVHLCLACPHLAAHGRVFLSPSVRVHVSVCVHQSVSTCSIRVSVHTNAIYSSCNLRRDPGTTWVPFALWTLKDCSIKLNGFLHLKQHSWSLGGTLVRLFLLFRCRECGLCAALSGNKGWKLLC